MSLPDFSGVHPTIRPIDRGEGSRHVDRDPRPVEADLAERRRAERCRFAYDRLYPPTNTDPASCGRAPFRAQAGKLVSITAYDEYGRPQLRCWRGEGNRPLCQRGRIRKPLRLERGQPPRLGIFAEPNPSRLVRRRTPPLRLCARRSGQLPHEMSVPASPSNLDAD